MNVLVINSGSSSLKFQLVHVETGGIITKGICDSVGSDTSFIKYGMYEDEQVVKVDLPDHVAAVQKVLELLTSGDKPVISSLGEINAVGHRIVHGGNYFDKSVIIDEDVVAKIEELAELAPLHNRAAVQGIRACQSYMPDVPQVAVFDTAFFQTMPPKAYMYPLPYELCEKYGIRKYGAHGTSHRYIAHRAANMLDEPLDELKLITCHLGNGCSMTAIDHGIAVDTTMGFTPLDGLMMGTRSGSIDPAIVPFLMEHEGLNTDEVNDLLNKQSGILGISGISNDLRTVTEAADKGDPRAAMAFEMYSHSVKKTIGSFITVMAGVDAIVLTAGVGENSRKMRSMIFAGLQQMGIRLDERKNKLRGFERIISADNSDVAIIVIPTDEEFMIARDTFVLVRDMKRAAENQE
ncbi:MAG: acetate kinase [Eggerthellales bacterium]|nr:acetate kinase [Eggerthellales bacterium]